MLPTYFLLNSYNTLMFQVLISLLLSSSAQATFAPYQPYALGGAYAGGYGGAIGGAYVNPVIANPKCKIETETIYNEQCVQTYKQVFLRFH